jgi:hypothetical protein
VYLARPFWSCSCAIVLIVYLARPFWSCICAVILVVHLRAVAAVIVYLRGRCDRASVWPP